MEGRGGRVGEERRRLFRCVLSVCGLSLRVVMSVSCQRGSFGLLFYAVMRDGIVAAVVWRIVLP